MPTTPTAATARKTHGHQKPNRRKKKLDASSDPWFNWLCGYGTGSRSGRSESEVFDIITITDVARLAGVSKSTVSRYINQSGYIGEGARTKIDAAVRKLNYRPNRMAQSLNGKSTGNVALVIANMANPLIGVYGGGVEDALFDHQLNTLICNTKFKLDREVAYVNMLLSKQIDGIIIAPCGDDHAHIL